MILTAAKTWDSGFTGDKAVVLTGEQVSRKPDFGSDWNVCQVVILYTVQYDSIDILDASYPLPGFSIGMCVTGCLPNAVGSSWWGGGFNRGLSYTWDATNSWFFANNTGSYYDRSLIYYRNGSRVAAGRANAGNADENRWFDTTQTIGQQILGVCLVKSVKSGDVLSVDHGYVGYNRSPHADLDQKVLERWVDGYYGSWGDQSGYELKTFDASNGFADTPLGEATYGALDTFFIYWPYSNAKLHVHAAGCRKVS